jgi:hypothetical protein
MLGTYLNWESASSNEVSASTGTCAPPVVGGLAPSSGAKTGGTSVLISSSGFTGASAVDFGAPPATGFVVDSDNQITATGPAGTLGTTVDVAVTTPLGASAHIAAGQGSNSPAIDTGSDTTTIDLGYHYAI